MTERITKNEERLDAAVESVRNLQEALEQFKANRKDISLLDRYYGSKAWLKDKEDWEQKKIPQVKAGVLSEDAVWNLLEDIDEVMRDMNDVVRQYYRKR
ncbi:MAG: DUF4298 domain-containing protein [Erysipelotrichaceae bacterium]|nr:DUF4298 domain-containing protein [Erysipelotrichaceae bacterium]